MSREALLPSEGALVTERGRGKLEPGHTGTAGHSCDAHVHVGWIPGEPGSLVGTFGMQRKPIRAGGKETAGGRQCVRPAHVVRADGECLPLRLDPASCGERLLAWRLASCVSRGLC